MFKPRRLVVGLIVYAALSTHLFSQSKLALEPVGRYIFQASSKDFTGTDHLLNALGLPNNKILVVSNTALTIVDASSMSIAGTTNYLNRSTGGGGRDAVIYKDTYVYVNFHQSESRNNTFGFGISKITDNTVSTLGNITEANVFYEKIKIDGDYLFVAAHSDGIRIYSLANPEKPTLVGSLKTGFTDAFDLAVSGNTLFVADGGGGLKIVDISTINAPKIIAGETTTSAAGTAQDIEVKNGIVYLASGGAGISVYTNADLSTRQIYPLNGCTEDLCWVGDYLAASSFEGVSVFEVSENAQLTKVGYERISRYNQKAYIRNSFGIGAANDSTLLVACWNSVDCYRIKPLASSKIPDIICSTQRIRFPSTGGNETHYITNNGGVNLNISSLSTLTSAYTTTLKAQSIAPSDTIYFDVTYKASAESTGETLYIYSDDPDENPLPIQLFGNTSSLDPGETVTDFTLPTFYTDPLTGVYCKDSFSLSQQKGKVVWIQIFGTWCPACPSAEVDMQNTIIKEFAENPNVATFVLNENQQSRDPESWVSFWATKFYQRAPMIYDEDGTVGSTIFSQPNAGNMPFGRGFIIDQNGIMLKPFFGHQPQMVISTIYDLLKNGETNTDKIIDNAYILSVYPNPAQNELTISTESSLKTISLYDSLGKKISEIFPTKNTVVINLSEFSNGIYIVNALTNKNEYQTVKFTVKK
ncbi:MAG: T9SS type A sorting domain-containing protein [Paludibacter sp.]|nr:T9SS type A sorting domain-containing protein [Paludibacter sp.]